MKHILVSFLGLAMLGSVAYAAGPDGYYKGHSYSENGKVRTHVFIKTVKYRSGARTTYGLIFRNKDSKKYKYGTGSLFKIETLDDGTQAWVQLFQSKDNILASDPNARATYEGQFYKNGKNIELTPTDFGTKIGCTEEIKAKRSGSRKWMSFPNKELKVTGKKDYKIRLKAHVKYKKRKGNQKRRIKKVTRVLNGKFRVNGKTYKGTFSVRQLLPGLAIIRQRKLDSETASGRSMKKEIIGLVAAIYREDSILWFIDDDYQELRVIRQEPQIQQCLSPTVGMDND